ncbi:uncharacterized protein LOC126893055 [Diabrotica virgifera virgifera]|uniref:CCHC-type domain-containing protein n=1 Tax=Diabrotica virgifera virgifera TaxID=50390 RepID=A0ABM5L935_DIAVI|nr:uncharacterized protein LOC126893055 [Diabrotica virgifera virgifera]
MEFKAAINSMQMSGNLYENWRFFIQRFKNYLQATELTKKPEITQCAQLLQLIGDEGFKIYNTFKFSTEEKDKLELLIKKFEAHFKPKSNVSNARYCLFTRKQEEGESVDKFITDIINKAKNCELENLEDSLIKPCITCGVADKTMRQRLLEEDEMSLEKAINLCKSIESSKIQSEKMKSEEVHYIKKRNFNKKYENREQWEDRRVNPTHSKSQDGQFNGKSGSSSGCSRCGMEHRGQPCKAYKAKCLVNTKNSSFDDDFMINFEVNKSKLSCRLDTGAMANCGRKHEKGDCPASRWKCYGCSKVGHVKRLCPNKKNSSTIGVVEESESDSVFQCNELNEDLWKLNMLKDEASAAPHKLKLLLNGELYIDFEVDTGACNDMVPIAKTPNSDEQDKGNLIQVKSPSIQTEAHPSSSLSQAVSGDCAVNSPGTETSLRRSSRIGKKRVRLDL